MRTSRRRTALTDVELDRRVARGKRVFMYAAFAMFLFFLLSLLNFDLVLMGAVSIILFGFVSLFFAGVYTSTSGIPTDFGSYPEQGVGWHWIAAAIQIPAVIVLTVRGILLYRAHQRSTG